jgi:signal transduction histidine kinase
MEDTSKPAHRIAFSIKPQDGDIIFDVHDNGIGMDQETLDKMFTLFFSAKGKKGTGLGLFIANKVVRQHGGAIAADSTPGQGTQIRVRIPKNKPLPGDATL